MSQYDIESLYEFLAHTPEKGLRSMLIDQTQFTEVHFNMLMKVIRVCNIEQFKLMFGSQQFPKVRFSDKETKLKKAFWKDCESCFLDRGVLFPASKSTNKHKDAA